MKQTQQFLTKHYLLSFYSSGRMEKSHLKILLREGVAVEEVKKLSRKYYKKSILALESGPG